MRVKHRDELSEAMDQFLLSKESFLLECELDIHENVYPMVLNGSPIDEMIGG